MAAKKRRQRKKHKAAKRSRKDPAARERALEALNRMRSDSLSLSQAARAAHTTPETVRKHIGKIIIRNPNGRYEAKPFDRLTRRVWLLTENGKIEISVRGSGHVARIARHMAAVDRYLRTGDAEPLKEFERQTVRSRNQKHSFLTDTKALDRLAQAGEVSFERLYARRA